MLARAILLAVLCFALGSSLILIATRYPELFENRLIGVTLGIVFFAPMLIVGYLLYPPREPEPKPRIEVPAPSNHRLSQIVIAILLALIVAALVVVGIHDPKALPVLVLFLPCLAVGWFIRNLAWNVRLVRESPYEIEFKRINSMPVRNLIVGIFLGAIVVCGWVFVFLSAVDL